MKDIKKYEKNLESYNSIIYPDQRQEGATNPNYKLYRQAHNSVSPKKQYGGMRTDARNKMSMSMVSDVKKSNIVADPSASVKNFQQKKQQTQKGHQGVNRSHIPDSISSIISGKYIFNDNCTNGIIPIPK